MSAAVAAAAPIRILLVDDHQTLLWGLERLIESAGPRMQLVGSARSLEEMFEKAAAGQPDLVLLDLDLGGSDASAAIAALQRDGPTQVLVLTGNRDPEIHSAAVMRGARGIVSKDEAAGVILQAIERVHSGDVWVSRQLMGRVLGNLADKGRERDPESDRIDSLTARERSIVAAVVRHSGAKGLVIADELGIGERTLRNQLSTIYSKLGVRNRIELYAYATRHGLVA